MRDSRLILMHQNGCKSRLAPLFAEAFHQFLPLSVDNCGHNLFPSFALARSVSMIAKHGIQMPRRKQAASQNVLFFPEFEGEAGALPPHITTTSEQAYRADGTHMSIHGAAAALSIPRGAVLGHQSCNVVISGSYRKDFDALRSTYEEFHDLGCKILSPSNVIAVSEHDGFVYMKGEETETPENIEDRHLDAILKANFVWLHTPEGYVGPTAALEVGFAHAAGVPVYAREEPKDKVLQSFIQLVSSPADLLGERVSNPTPPAPALKAFQEYYRRAALQRGYTNEGPKECLLLMVEEVGELARALRKREKLVRHGTYHGSNEAHELADVFLYVVHMANILGFDLAHIVRDKEVRNVQRFLAQ